MSTLKKTTDNLTGWFKSHPTINDTSSGDISEIDLSGHTEYPIMHLIYLTTTYPSGIRTFNYQILILNSYLEARDDKLEVISGMDEIAAEFVASLYGGSLFRARHRINTTPTSDVMYDQLKNRLYGVSLNLSITVPYTGNC